MVVRSVDESGQVHSEQLSATEAWQLRRLGDDFTREIKAKQREVDRDPVLSELEKQFQRD